jgi:hypothetical protein
MTQTVNNVKRNNQAQLANIAKALVSELEPITDGCA